VGRIPVGALTDRLGARMMFPAVSFLTILPVLFVGLLGDSYPLLLVGGFLLGLGGTSFAVGVPLVNAWYPPARRGLALGVFGMGMGGTAVSAFTTVLLATRYGRPFSFLLVAVYGAVAAALLRDAPGRTVPTGSFLARTWATLRMRATLQLSALYAVAFGGFVAFNVYLPTYLKNAYGLTQADAAGSVLGRGASPRRRRPAPTVGTVGPGHRVRVREHQVPHAGVLRAPRDAPRGLRPISPPTPRGRPGPGSRRTRGRPPSGRGSAAGPRSR
jgi:nitrate/nitrite transporter NarK